MEGGAPRSEPEPLHTSLPSSAHALSPLTPVPQLAVCSPGNAGTLLERCFSLCFWAHDRVIHVGTGIQPHPGNSGARVDDPQRGPWAVTVPGATSVRRKAAGGAVRAAARLWGLFAPLMVLCRPEGVRGTQELGRGLATSPGSQGKAGSGEGGSAAPVPLPSGPDRAAP